METLPLALSAVAAVVLQFAASFSIVASVVFCLWRFSPMSPRARRGEERVTLKDGGGAGEGRG